MSYNVTIWDGMPRTFANLTASGSGSTPFGLYESDNDFTASAPKVAKYCANRLGYPIVDIELQDINFYACFEDAVNTYGSGVNSYNIRNNLFELQGTSTGSNLTQREITPSMGRYITISKMYGSEAGSGGDVDWKHGYIMTSASIQEYDLNTLWADVSESGNKIEIKKVYHHEFPAKARYYDPYIGIGSTYYMMRNFGWENYYSPAVSFVMMPVYEELLRMQAIEFNQMVRRSAYSFDIHNNKIRIFPIPDINNLKVWFDYVVVADRNNPLKNSDGVISDYSNVPYQIITYSRINSVGKQWIREYSYVLAKEMLGNVRSKYSSIPIPDGEVSMDGETLRSEAQTEKEQLLTQLRETLEATGKRAQMEARNEVAENLQNVLGRSPLPIYIG